MIEDRHPLPNNNNNIESIQNRNVRKSSEYSGSGSRSKSNNIKTVSNQVTELPPSVNSSNTNKIPNNFFTNKQNVLHNLTRHNLNRQLHLTHRNRVRCVKENIHLYLSSLIVAMAP